MNKKKLNRLIKELDLEYIGYGRHYKFKTKEGMRITMSPLMINQYLSNPTKYKYLLNQQHRHLQEVANDEYNTTRECIN